MAAEVATNLDYFWSSLILVALELFSYECVHLDGALVKTGTRKATANNRVLTFFTFMVGADEALWMASLSKLLATSGSQLE